jgi:hypothetical protein
VQLSRGGIMADSVVVACGPTEQECRALVERIVTSKEFQRANRLRDFLVYVVDRKLADAPQETTETLIGHRVFGRPPMYNTGEDSIVRTEAHILRQRLDRYFAREGLDEPIVLEIPKGSYVPVFHRRDLPLAKPLPPPPPAHSHRRLAIWLTLLAGTLTAAFVGWRVFTKPSSHPANVSAAPSQIAGLVELEASDPQLMKSFRWAKERAIGYAYTADPVGDWYDSTAGDRNAFCMRDVSHQSIGAAVLGLTAHTRNMLRRFAGSISPSRDWGGFWEINKDGFPAPIDYKDDGHFWYCLPANFDVMQASYRQYLWTGDQSYFDSVFSNFYDRTVTDYVAAWDRNRDGLMESSPDVRPRGIPSYYQQKPEPLVGGDLIAAQYKGYLVYAAMQQQKGARGSLSQKLAEEYTTKAQALRLRFNTEWWNSIQNRHYSLLLPNRTFYPGYVAETNVFALLFGFTEDGLKTEAALDSLEKNRPEFPQKLSYYPEILFQYGRNEPAYQYLLELTDPNFGGRGMPEIVFAVVGATAAGMAGISPDARYNTLETLPRLPKAVDWLRLSHVPVLKNEVNVWHRGVFETTLTNQAGPPIQWKASFRISSPDLVPHVSVDGVPVEATVEQRINHQLVASILIPVKPGQTRTAQYLEH